MKLGALVVFTLGALMAPAALAQAREKVLYSFCAESLCADGEGPVGKLVSDGVGNLYGTTVWGGLYGYGVVFEIKPSSGGIWTESVLYNFCVNGIENCPDGANPMAGLSFDESGNLYGTTQGGGTYGLGTVFELTPPATQGGAWTESLLWSFGASGDGAYPVCDLILDADGKLYGTTTTDKIYGGGIVFQLSPGVDGQWSEDVLFAFGPTTSGGFDPRAGVTFDKLGNLYGTTARGGSKGQGDGVVYRLSPNLQLPWTETVLFKFKPQTGIAPLSTVTFDSLGNLYGTVSEDGGFNGGIFKLTPEGRERSLLFLGTSGPSSPTAGVLLDGRTLYGTTTEGGLHGGGTVFEASGTTATVLYGFCSQPGCSDGNQPQSAVIRLGKSLYGTTYVGGAWNCGAVYQISSDEMPSTGFK